MRIIFRRPVAVTINAVPCKWHTDTETTCDGSGIDITVQGNRHLLVGVDLDTTQIHTSAHSPTATYDITVTLQ